MKRFSIPGGKSKIAGGTPKISEGGTKVLGCIASDESSLLKKGYGVTKTMSIIRYGEQKVRSLLQKIITLY